MEELKTSTLKLVKEVQGLRKVVEALDQDLEETKAASNRKTAIFGVILAVVAALAVVSISTSLRLRTLSEEVWCPLYAIFNDSYNPNSLAAKAQGIEKYNSTFDDIRRQYAVLDCATKE